MAIYALKFLHSGGRGKSRSRRISVSGGQLGLYSDSRMARATLVRPCLKTQNKQKDKTKQTNKKEERQLIS